MSTNTPPNISRDAIERAFFNHDTKGAETSTEKWLKRKSEWRSFLSYLEKSQDQPKTEPESIAHHEASKENPKPSPQVGMGVGLPQDASIPTPETRVTGPGFTPTWLGATEPASASKEAMRIPTVEELHAIHQEAKRKSWVGGTEMEEAIVVGIAAVREAMLPFAHRIDHDLIRQWKSRAESAETQLASLQTKYDVACQTISQLQNERMHRDSFTALSNLSSWLSQGAGDETTTPDEYEGRIRAGVDQIIGVEVQRREEAEAKLAETKSALRSLQSEIIAQHKADMKTMEEKPWTPKFKVGQKVRMKPIGAPATGPILEVVNLTGRNIQVINPKIETTDPRTGASSTGCWYSEEELEPYVWTPSDPPTTPRKRVPWNSTHDMPMVGSLWLRSKDDYRDHLVIGVANPCAIIMATCGSGPVIQSQHFSDMRWDVMEWSFDRKNWQECSKEEP